MIRLTLIIFIQSLVIHTVHAQYYYIPYLDNPGNPGNHNTQTEIQAQFLSNWTLIQGTSATPVWSPIQTLPFSFNFNGQTVSQYKVSTSGILTFDIGVIAVPDTIPENLPSSSIPDNSICIWGMNGTGSDDGIVTRTYGIAPNREHWIFFPSFTLGSGFTYWSMMLEETSNDIYIVDQRHSSSISGGLTLGIQVNSTIASEVAGSPTVQPVSSGAAISSDNNYYHFMYGTQPSYDIAMMTNDMMTYHSISNIPIEVKGSFANYGSNAISAFDINYLINGILLYTQTINGVNIIPYATHSFTHPETWTPDSAGSYVLDLYATNINGNQDENNLNDTISKLIEVIDTLIPRNVLHEVFTSSTCNPCNLGNEILDSILHENSNKWTCIKYQMDIPGAGDPYFTEEVGLRSSYYNFTGIPRVFLDGSYGANPQGYNQNDFDYYNNIPSFVNLKGHYTLVGQTITISAEITPIKNFQSNSIKAFIAIVETETSNNVKTNGETSFSYVMKKMIPNVNGIDIPVLTENQTLSIEESYTFQGSYTLPIDASNPINSAIEHSVEDFNNLQGVVFLQDTITKEILQSAWVGTAYNVAIATNHRYDNSIILFPNPSNGLVNYIINSKSDLVSTNIKIYNHYGQKVGANMVNQNPIDNSKGNLNFSGLPSGIYSIVFQDEKYSITEKIVYISSQ